jgi:hypothetical protein
MRSITQRLRAYAQGVTDGLAEPYSLGSGMSYGDERDETYDGGVNMGQWIGRVWDAVRRGPTDQEDT